MKLRIKLSFALAALLAGCSSRGIAPPLIGGPLTDAHKTTQHAYWTLYAGRTYPEVQGAKFGANLEPSLLYTNADIQGAGCAWGIAIH
jgi:hypothetical protein